jgi:hypothetical protein
MLGKTLVRSADTVLVDVIRSSPVDTAQHRWRAIVLVVMGALVLAIGGSLAWELLRDTPVVYTEIEDHFKYGSIGSEPGGDLMSSIGGLLPPERVFRVLPAICPEQAPNGYATFGFLSEQGHDLPIGISQRHRLGVDQVGANCAMCHTGTYRESASSKPTVVLGMPANNLDLQGLFRFVLSCTLDNRFTSDNVVGRIEEQQGKLGPFEKFLYRSQVVPRVRSSSLEMRNRVGLLVMGDTLTAWGHGRVDTFNPYKATQFHWSLDKLDKSELIGAADYPSLWNQKPREGLHLHWDGNNDSVDERNLSAALGAGVTPVTVDHEAIKRVRDWIWELKPPAYPFPIDRAKVAAGQVLYAQYCRDCHADHSFRDGVKHGGDALGHVEPLAEIGTDPSRLHAYTYEFSVNQYTLYPSSKYRFTHFRKTDGYANHPLDGIWLRAPYLHNGSVPTLRDLLDAPDARPKSFYKGNDVLDQVRLGYVTSAASEGKRRFERFETSLPGNGNQGHNYGTQLQSHEKDALVEYLKTF